MNDPTAGAPGLFLGVMRFVDVCESREGLKLGIAGTRSVTDVRRPKPVRWDAAMWSDEDPKG